MSDLALISRLLLLAVAQARGLDASPVMEARQQLHTPDDIAPAVLPYLACLYAERGLPLLHASDGTRVDYDRGTGDCSAARAHAKDDAARLLHRKRAPDGLNVGEYVDRTLSDMDDYVASIPTSKQRGSAAPSAVVGIPVTIEDEVQPAYARYDECLKTQVSNSPVTAQTVMDKFNTAMKFCDGVREFAVNQAKNALIAKGWNETTRTRAAETTFAKVDESWLAMGKQFQEALLQKAAQLAKTPSAGVTARTDRPKAPR